jgi:hypothetical protein
MVFSIRRWTSSATRKAKYTGEEEAKLSPMVHGILGRCYPTETPETVGKNRMKECPSGKAGMSVMPEAPAKHVHDVWLAVKQTLKIARQVITEKLFYLPDMPSQSNQRSSVSSP